MVFSAEVARIGNANEVVAVFWGGEMEYGVFAARSPSVIVVFVEEFEHGEAVGWRDGSGWEGAHDVGWCSERVRNGGGIEVGVAGSLAGVNDETGVGATGVHPELYDFAVAVEELVKFHFAEVLDAKIV